VRAATRRRIAVPAAITAGLLCSGLLVWHSSYAAFTASTQTQQNSFRAGSVALTNDHSESVVFATTDKLVPGSADTQCVEVDYQGDVASEIRLYAAGNLTDNLAQYLNFKIDLLPVGAACESSSSVVLYNTAPLSGLGTATSFATGLNPDSWKPTGPEKRLYRFSYSLPEGDAAQNKTADITFVWQAQSQATP
jgi:predicted ribosomally synthesized peptide with SipW-like signal peptide